jgi:hypothetical protein
MHHQQTAAAVWAMGTGWKLEKGMKYMSSAPVVVLSTHKRIPNMPTIKLYIFLPDRGANLDYFELCLILSLEGLGFRPMLWHILTSLALELKKHEILSSSVSY